MIRRKRRHRQPTGYGPWAQVLSAVAVLLGFGFIGWAVVSSLLGGGDDGNRPVPSESSVSAPASVGEASESPSWPVETREPVEDIVPGDGTFLDPETVDRTDPDAVAEAAASLYGSHDTLVDSSEAGSRERVAPLLDPSLLEIPQSAEADLVWLDGQKHDAYSLPLVTPLVVPALGHEHAGETAEEHATHVEAGRIGMPTVTADGEPALGYQFDVLFHWKGRDGWVSPPEAGQKREVRLALVERDGEWIIVEAFYGSPRIPGLK